MAKRHKTNKYRQIPVERPPEPAKPWEPNERCPVSAGDAVRCHLKRPLLSLHDTCIVHEVVADKRYTSGWRVGVKDTNGEMQWIDSWYFKRINQPD